MTGRVLFVADIHAGSHRGFAVPTQRPGVNSRLAMALEVLTNAGAQTKPDDTIVILGDLFDTDKPSPQVITSVLQVLNGFPGTSLCLRGNHDSSTPREGDNALGPLSEAGHLVVEVPRVLVYGDTLLVLLPFNPAPPIEWVPATLAALRPEIERHSGAHHLIVGSHFGISDAETPDFLSHGALPIDTAFALCSEYTAVAWLSGDWHTRKVWERGGVTVAQVGALVPTGFDNPGLTGYGSLWTFDGTRLYYEEMAGPRFVKYKSAAVAVADHRETCAPTQRFAQVTVSAGEVEAATAALTAAVSEGRLGGFVVVENRNEAVENAGETAAYVATATSFDAALERSVERLTLGEGVSRGEVLRRARERVAKAKGRA